jgi:hypothetical protein
VMCDEHCIGGDGEDSGGNDAQLDLVNVLSHEAMGGKYVPRAVFFDLGLCVFRPRALRDRRCARVSARRALPSGKPREPYARAKMGQRPLQRG